MQTGCECALTFFSFRIFFRRSYYGISDEEYHLPPHLIKVGQICVALYEGQWHRARIVDVFEDGALKVIISLFSHYGSGGGVS